MALHNEEPCQFDADSGLQAGTGRRCRLIPFGDKLMFLFGMFAFTAGDMIHAGLRLHAFDFAIHSCRRDAC